MVTFVTQDPCGLCGYVREGFMVSTIRVNKRSLRTTGGNLVVLPNRCRECGAECGRAPSPRFVLSPEDSAKVEAYRLKKWPELAVSAPSTPGGGEPHSKINAPGSSPLFTDKEAEG